MKTTISLPDPLFARATQIATRLHISRSKLYAIAVAQFVNAYRSRDITERLNEVYAEV